MQVGFGYDIHKLVPKRKLIIGGIEIPYSKGLLGHTDADVLIHAIIDALLGATGKQDIGNLFPDTDERWKDANSLELLKIVSDDLKKEGHRIINIDSTVVLEEPKLKDYIPQMRKKLASVLELNSINQLNIKSKTNEGQDAIGTKRAICAFAVALVQ